MDQSINDLPDTGPNGVKHQSNEEKTRFLKLRLWDLFVAMPNGSTSYTLAMAAFDYIFDELNIEYSSKLDRLEIAHRRKETVINFPRVGQKIKIVDAHPTAEVGTELYVFEIKESAHTVTAKVHGVDMGIIDNFILYSNLGFNRNCHKAWIVL